MNLGTRLQNIVGEYRNILVTDGIVTKEELIKMLKLDEEIDSEVDYSYLADKILDNIEEVKEIVRKPYNNKDRSKKNKQRMELYNKGMTDNEIAAIVGVHPTSIWYWRDRNKLPAHNIKKNGKGGRKKKNENM